MRGPAIEFIDVRALVDGRPVLRGVNFAAPPGVITALLGPRDAGKTTCLRHVVGLARPSAGEVIVDGRPVARLRPRELAELRRRFGVMFEGGSPEAFALFGAWTALENVAFPIRLGGRRREALVDARARGLLRDVGMEGYEQRRPDELPAPLRQRVALARALAAIPEFVLLDGLETASQGLDLARLCELVRERHEAEGGTYLVATESPDLAVRLADEVVMLRSGRVVDPSLVDDLRPLAEVGSIGESLG